MFVNRKRGMEFMLTLAAIATASLAQTPAPPVSHRPGASAEIQAFIQKNADRWLSYYYDLHRNPELSLAEAETAKKAAARLTAAGYRVTSGIGGYGVVGVLENGPGPVVLIRGDMDALPIVEETGAEYASRVRVHNDVGVEVGVMHACGHDIHQTVLLGTADALGALRNEWKGTALIVVQPAEEIGRGAEMMIEAGLFQRFPKPIACLALHCGPGPAGTISYTPGWALANVDSVDITIHGRGGHGSRPHECIDPIVAAAQVINALQTITSRRLDPMDAGVVTVGSIHAGTKHNIIPDSVALQLTVRSYTDPTRRLLLDSIRTITTGTCQALGCPKLPDVRVREDEFTPACYNDPDLTASAMALLRAELGDRSVIETPGVMGAEDFGRLGKHIGAPSLIFWLGSQNPERWAQARDRGETLPNMHSARYHPDAPPTIRTGVQAMTALALGLFAAP